QDTDTNGKPDNFNNKQRSAAVFGLGPEFTVSHRVGSLYHQCPKERKYKKYRQPVSYNIFQAVAFQVIVDGRNNKSGKKQINGHDNDSVNLDRSEERRVGTGGSWH